MKALVSTLNMPQRRPTGVNQLMPEAIEKTCTMSTAPTTSPAEHDAVHPPLKKQFNAATLLSMAFIICNSWAGISVSVQLALLQGGPVTLVYSILISTTAYFAIAASLAELTSVYPTAGGQYHFTSILAPKKARRFLSYACGLLALFSWVAIGVAVTMIIAEQLMAVVAATHEGFVLKPWQVFLVYEAVVLFAFLYNLLALKRAPWTHSIGCEQSPSLCFDTHTDCKRLSVACSVLNLLRRNSRSGKSETA